MNKMKKDKLALAIILGIITVVLVSTIFMQFKTIEKTDIAELENMRETELKTQIASWKAKHQELTEKLQENQEKIQEYEEKQESTEEAEALLKKELEQSNMLIGKTDVQGEGVVITLTDNDEQVITPSDLLELVNELNYAGAEAIAINDIRILNMTDITYVTDGFALIGDNNRAVSPYVVKAIGNQTYLSSTLSLKNVGFVDKYMSMGYTIKLEKQKQVKIPKHKGEIKLKYVKEEAKE